MRCIAQRDDRYTKRVQSMQFHLPGRQDHSTLAEWQSPPTQK